MAHKKSETYYVHQAIRQFWKRAASIIAVKCDRVEHCVQTFNIDHPSLL